MSWFRPRDLLDQTFEVGIILKGLDGVLEVIGGLLLLVVSPATIDQVVTSLTPAKSTVVPETARTRIRLRACSTAAWTPPPGAGTKLLMRTSWRAAARLRLVAASPRRGRDRTGPRTPLWSRSSSQAAAHRSTGLRSRQVGADGSFASPPLPTDVLVNRATAVDAAGRMIGTENLKAVAPCQGLGYAPSAGGAAIYPAWPWPAALAKGARVWGWSVLTGGSHFSGCSGPSAH